VVLVDPALEDPPRGFLDLPPAANPTIAADPDALHFFTVRAPFYWENPEHRRYMAGLIRIVLAAPYPTYLIVQDYTGRDIQEVYTSFLHGEFGSGADCRALLNRVLFDPSYDGPGCFQDLTVPILRHPATGDFLQPAYIPLQRLRHSQPSSRILNHYTDVRSTAIRYYAYRLLRALRGETEMSPHATPEIVCEKLQFFAPIVGYTPTAHPTVLRNLIADTLRDFGALCNRSYTDEAVDALLANPPGLTAEFHDLRQRILGTLE
jgi:hypothetical protein